MKVWRTLLVLLLALLTPVTISAFWAHQSLRDHDAYADRMVAALADPAVQEEFGAAVTAAVEERLFPAPTMTDSSFLANAARSIVTDTVTDGIGSPEFARAWRDWQAALHRDLLLVAQGGTPPETQISADTLRVNVAPLVLALLAGGLGSLASNFVGDSPIMVDLELTSDVPSQLAALNTLAQSRWFLALGLIVIVLALFSVAYSKPRLFAAAFLVAALSCLGAGIAVVTAVGTTPTDSTTPLLAAAVTDAVLAGWPQWLFVGAGIAIVVSLLAALAGRSRTAPTQHPA